MPRYGFCKGAESHLHGPPQAIAVKSESAADASQNGLSGAGVQAGDLAFQMPEREKRGIPSTAEALTYGVCL